MKIKLERSELPYELWTFHGTPMMGYANSRLGLFPTVWSALDHIKMLMEMVPSHTEPFTIIEV